tara:strand:+ start:14689 stop:15186 length:498 start_codon:yes stop_codon:yes gene_type:complete
MKSIRLFFTLLVIPLILTSCGYQLRGSADLDGLEEIKIISNGYTSISQLLAKKLGPTNLSQNSTIDTYPIIKIVGISTKKRQLSVNSSGRVDEYEISKSLDYEISLSENIKIKDTIKASASYDFNESQMQGTKEQELIANNAIDRTLVRKLIYKIRSKIKSSNPS